MQADFELLTVQMSNGGRAMYECQEINHSCEVWLLSYYLDAGSAARAGDAIEVRFNADGLQAPTTYVAKPILVSGAVVSPYTTRAVMLIASGTGGNYVNLHSPLLVCSSVQSQKLCRFECELWNSTQNLAVGNAAAGAGFPVLTMHLAVVKRYPNALPARLLPWQRNAGAVYHEYS